MATKLTVAESRKLKQHEDVIEAGERAFIEVGRSLLAIREEGLYLEVADTFEGYVKKRWGKSRDWAYRQITAMEVSDDISGLEVEIPGENGVPVLTIVNIDNEGQARELAKLETMQDRANAMQKAVASAKVVDGKPQVTAAGLKKAIKESKPSAPPDNGSPGLVAAVEVIEEDDPTAEECMESAASDIEKFCRYILKEWKDKMPHDPWLDYKGLSDSAGQAIKSALATMRLAKCKDLCPKCDWNEKCKTCLGTGRIPKCELNQLG